LATTVKRSILRNRLEKRIRITTFFIIYTTKGYSRTSLPTELRLPERNTLMWAH